MSEEPRAPAALILAAAVCEGLAALMAAAFAACLLALLYVGALDSRVERLFAGFLAFGLALSAWRLGGAPLKLGEQGAKRSDALRGLLASLTLLACGGYLLVYAHTVFEELGRLLGRGLGL